MSHRKGQPKRNASERTQRRWRIRKDIPTVADEKHISEVQKIKDGILEWFNRNKQEEPIEVKTMPGARK